MATTASEHATATLNLSRIAAWVVAYVDATRAPRNPRC